MKPATNPGKIVSSNRSTAPTTNSMMTSVTCDHVRNSCCPSQVESNCGTCARLTYVNLSPPASFSFQAPVFLCSMATLYGNKESCGCAGLHYQGRLGNPR